MKKLLSQWEASKEYKFPPQAWQDTKQHESSMGHAYDSLCGCWDCKEKRTGEDNAPKGASEPESPPKKFYECGICSCLHPWNWDGDCREDGNRYLPYSGGPSDQLEVGPDDEIMSWEDRCEEDA